MKHLIESLRMDAQRDLDAARTAITYLEWTPRKCRYGDTLAYKVAMLKAQWLQLRASVVLALLGERTEDA